MAYGMQHYAALLSTMSQRRGLQFVIVMPGCEKNVYELPRWTPCDLLMVLSYDCLSVIFRSSCTYTVETVRQSFKTDRVPLEFPLYGFNQPIDLS